VIYRIYRDMKADYRRIYSVFCLSAARKHHLCCRQGNDVLYFFVCSPCSTISQDDDDDVAEEPDVAEGEREEFSRLARCANFRSAVLRMSLATLSHATASEAHAAALAGAAGCSDDASRPSCGGSGGPTVSEALVLAAPLFHTAHLTAVATAGVRSASSQRKTQAKLAGEAVNKDKDAAEGLPLLALHCIDAVVKAAGTRQSLAAVLRSVPVASPPSDNLPAADWDDASNVIASRVGLLRQLLAKLLETQSFKGVEVLLGVVTAVGDLLPSEGRVGIAGWIKAACMAHEVAHPGAARALAQALLHFLPPGDVQVAVASELPYDPKRRPLSFFSTVLSDENCETCEIAPLQTIFFQRF